MSTSVLDQNIIEKLGTISLSNVELEARFTQYGISKGVDIRVYDRLLEHFTFLGFSKIETQSTDFTIKDVRQRLTVDSQGNKKLITKSPIPGYPKEANIYGIKIGVSIEEDLSSNQELINQFIVQLNTAPIKTIRNKNRTSFLLFEGQYTGVRLDLTRVVMSETGTSIDPVYEVELELINPGELRSWIYFIPKILAVIQDTEIVYTFQDYKDIIGYTNYSIGGNIQDVHSIDNRNLMDARNLRYRDITYGGLISDRMYWVSIKSDGLRKLLVIHPSGIWLIWNTEANKLYNTSIVSDTWNGYIFDGEFIPKSSRKNGYQIVSQKYWFLIFDLIAKPKDNIRERTHRTRMSTAQTVVDNLNSLELADLTNLLKLNTKQFVNLESIPQSFSTMRQIDIQRSVVEYNDDGFIFVPDRAPYARINVPMSERVLTKYPDICKWKSKEDLTIDFSIGYIMQSSGKSKTVILGYNPQKRTYLIEVTVKPDGSVSVLYHPLINQYLYEGKLSRDSRGNYLYNSKFDLSKINSNGNVLFTYSRGKYIGQFSDRPSQTAKIIASSLASNKDFVMNVVWKLVNIKGVEYKIMESFYVDVENPYSIIDQPIDEHNEMLKGLPTGFVVEFKWDSKIKKFIPIRKRYNKKYPNSMSTIEDNLSLLTDPIELETLRGETINLMRKYHNQIKNRLFYSNEGNLLDLGSGRGGDVSKWRKYQKIIAVEPNETHIVELERRIKSIFGLPEVLKIKTSGDLARYRNDNIVIVITTAQNHTLITEVVNQVFKQKADVISMMLSLSFFFSSSEVYQGLMTTINENLIVGGRFIYLTIDGEKVKLMFDPPIKGPIIDELNLQNGNIKMKYLKEINQLQVNFKGTIVGTETEDQLESLVNLNDIRVSFNNLGIFEEHYKDATEEKFLNESETILTKLYSYGSFIRKSEPTTLVKVISPYLISGISVKPLTISSDIQGNISNRQLETVECKWYFVEKIFRTGMVQFEDPMINLISTILTLQKVPESDNFNTLYDLSIQHKSSIKLTTIDLDSPEVTYRDKINVLEKIFNINIFIVKITARNLIPVITKVGEYFQTSIILGIVDQDQGIYESILPDRKDEFKGYLNDPLVIAFLGISFFSLIPPERIKVAEPLMERISKGTNDYTLLSELAKYK